MKYIHKWLEYLTIARWAKILLSQFASHVKYGLWPGDQYFMKTIHENHSWKPIYR